MNDATRKAIEETRSARAQVWAQVVRGESVCKAVNELLERVDRLVALLEFENAELKRQLSKPKAAVRRELDNVRKGSQAAQLEAQITRERLQQAMTHRAPEVAAAGFLRTHGDDLTRLLRSLPLHPLHCCERQLRQIVDDLEERKHCSGCGNVLRTTPVRFLESNEIVINVPQACAVCDAAECERRATAERARQQEAVGVLERWRACMNDPEFGGCEVDLMASLIERVRRGEKP